MADGATAAAGVKPKVKMEIPVAEIRDAVKSYPECMVRLRRRNLRGNWAGVGASVRKATEDLVDVEDWIRSVAGGGMFRVEATSVDDKTRFVVPPFDVELEGAEQPSKIAVTAPQTSGGSGATLGGRGPSESPRHWGPTLVNDSGTEIAQEHARDYRSDFVTERQAREEDRRRHEQEMTAMRERLDQIETQRTQELQAAKERHLLDKLEALEQRMVEGAQRQPTGGLGNLSSEAMIGIATAFAGVLTAVIDSNKARTQLQTDSLQKSVSDQLGFVKELVKKPNDEFGSITKLAEVFGPIVKTMMEERSPGKIAELVGAQADASMQTLSIVSQFLDRMMPGESDNPWVDMGRQVVNSLTKAAEEMGQYTRSSLGGGGRGSQQAQQIPANATPNQIADAIYHAPGLPSAFKTPAWHEAFFNIHVRADPRAVAGDIARLLSAMDRPPQPFSSLFDDENHLPSTHLEVFLRQMPIAQIDPRYVQALLQEFDRAFQSTPEDSAGEEEEELHEAPRPQPTEVATPSADGEPPAFVQVETPPTD